MLHQMLARLLHNRDILDFVGRALQLESIEKPFGAGCGKYLKMRVGMTLRVEKVQDGYIRSPHLADKPNILFYTNSLHLILLPKKLVSHCLSFNKYVCRTFIHSP